jgi:hypothetical protein
VTEFCIVIVGKRRAMQEVYTDRYHLNGLKKRAERTVRAGAAIAHLSQQPIQSSKHKSDRFVLESDNQTQG